MKKIFFIILFLQLCFQISIAQQLPTAVLDKNTIKIGDQVTLTLSIKTNSTTQFTWPVIADTIIANIDVVKKNEIDTIKNSDNTVTYKQVLVITSFDAGTYTIPSFIFSNQTAKTTGVLATSPLTLSVSTIPVDITKPIKDITTPIEIPFSWIDLIPYLVLIHVILGIVLLVLWLIKHKKKNVPLLSLIKEKQIPPHEYALKALEELRLKKLWQQAKYKEYYTELIDILRDYIEKRYGILAQEMISDEIISALKHSLIDATLISRLATALATADLVKFAKDQPLPEINQREFDSIVFFINQTTVLVKEADSKGGQNEVV